MREKLVPTLPDYLAVLALTLLSGLAYYLSGVRFDAATFPLFMQFIDRDLLETRFLESVWYAHAHPPGLNALVGAAVISFGTHAPTVLGLVFHALGLVVALAVFSLTLRLGGSRSAAYAATFVVVASPGFVLYENWLMYTFLEAALLAASAVALYRFLDSDKLAWAVALFALLAVLALTRSFFHLVWLLLIVAYVALGAPSRRRVLRAAAVPLLIVVLWYGKNYYYFGSFSASTMLGLGLSNITTLTVPREALRPLVEQGRLSSLALVSRYEEADKLFSDGDYRDTGIPVLDRPRKMNGEYNYNYQPLIEINRQYARDAWVVARSFPASYVLGLIGANRLFFSPSSMNEYFSPANRAAAKPFERVFDPVVYGVSAEPRYLVQPHFGFDRPASIEVNTSWRLAALWLLVLVWGYMQARRAFLKAQGPVDRAAALTIGYVVLVMLYVWGVGTALELGENYRYRFAVEPLFAALLTVLVVDGWRRARAWLKRRSG